MKTFLLSTALFLSPVAAFAQTAAPKLPATVELPTSTVGAVLNYLGTRPYNESAQMIGAIDGCVQVQIPNAQGAIVSHGQCPEVTQAMDARAAQVSGLQKQVADLQKKIAGLKAPNKVPTSPQKAK